MESRNVNLVPVPATELLKKCKNKEDIINLCRELGNYDIYIIIIIGYFFPREKGFDGKYFLQWGAGQKKVSIFFNFLFSYSILVKQVDILSAIFRRKNTLLRLILLMNFRKYQIQKIIYLMM